MCQLLDLPASGAVEIERYKQELDRTYREIVADLPTNPYARIEGNQLIVPEPDAPEEPESRKLGRERVRALMPWV